MGWLRASGQSSLGSAGVQAAPKIEAASGCTGGRTTHVLRWKPKQPDNYFLVFSTQSGRKVRAGDQCCLGGGPEMPRSRGCLASCWAFWDPVCWGWCGWARRSRGLGHLQQGWKMVLKSGRGYSFSCWNRRNCGVYRRWHLSVVG